MTTNESGRVIRGEGGGEERDVQGTFAAVAVVSMSGPSAGRAKPNRNGRRLQFATHDLCRADKEK